jgi:fermentation-respiration switch protein FrsA (DUF1100 family)
MPRARVRPSGVEESDLALIRRQAIELPSNLLNLFMFLFLANFATACGIENRIIFQPNTSLERTPRDLGLEFEDIYFEARDGVRLNGWFIPFRESTSTLVWFHGNAGNIGDRVENIKLLHDYVHLNIFIFDYRGYGRSEGRPSEEGVYLDGEAALELVKNKTGNVAASKTILFGRSLGAAIATEMATRFESEGLILESPFISVSEMARVVFPLLPIAPLLQTRFDALEKIQKIKVPLLVLHGDRDEVVPYEHGKRVFEIAPEPKRFFTIPGASHNDTYIVGGERYFQQLKEFIDGLGVNPPNG